MEVEKVGKNENYINRILISGYRSIKECDLNLRDINVLIGSNGAGKTNLLSVFTMLQYILERELKLFIGKSGMSSIFYNGIKMTNKVTLTLFFGSSYGNSYSFALEPTNNNSVVFRREEFSYKPLICAEPAMLEEVSGGHDESLWKQIGGNEDSKTIIPILESLQFRVYHFCDTGKEAKLKAEHRVSNNKVLLYDAANLASFLYRLRNNYHYAYQHILETVQLIAPFIKDFELEPEEKNNDLIVLRWKQKGCEDVFNVSQLSDGTLRFICLVTLLLQPKELQPSLIIIDEPELGLHPYAVTVFCEMVKKTALDKQVILSTQSVELLNQFDADDVIVVDCGDNGSEIRRLCEEDLTDWLENDYELGELWQKNILGGRLSK